MKAFIALLSYTGTIWLPTHEAIIHEIGDLQANGVKVMSKSLMGCTYIHSARGQMASLFMQTDATHLIFIDWDMVWNTGSLMRLISHDVDVVGADYPRRKEPIKYNARFLEVDGKSHDRIEENGLLEVAGIPTGFMVIKRGVLEKMIEAFPDLIFEDGDAMIKQCLLFFAHLKDNKTLLSDDYSFCDRWREIGGKVYVDTQIPIGHIGQKMFVGNYLDWLLPTLKLPIN